MPRKATAKPMVAESEQEVGAAIQAKKKRGLKPASVTDNFHGDPKAIGDIVSKAHSAMKMPPVKDDKELVERIDQYFESCAKYCLLPKWEGMALYCGVVRETFWKWRNGIGCSPERSNIIKKANDALACIDADLVENGLIPQVVYIFRAKNFFDMKDQQDVIITPNNPLGQELNQATLEAKIEGIVVDEQ